MGVDDVSDAMNYMAGKQGLQVTMKDGKVSSVGPSELVKQQQDVPFTTGVLPDWLEDIAPSAMAEFARLGGGTAELAGNVLSLIPGVDVDFDVNEASREGLDAAQDVVSKRSPGQAFVGGIAPYLLTGVGATAAASKGLPGVSGYLSGTGIGALEGGVRLPEQDSSRAEGAVIGALTGGLGQAAQRGISVFGGSRIREGVGNKLGKVIDKGLDEVPSGISNKLRRFNRFGKFKGYDLDKVGPSHLSKGYKFRDIGNTEKELAENILRGTHGNAARWDVQGTSHDFKKPLKKAIKDRQKLLLEEAALTNKEVAPTTKKDLLEEVDSLQKKYDQVDQGEFWLPGYNPGGVAPGDVLEITKNPQAYQRLSARLGQSASILGDILSVGSRYTPATGPKRYAKLYRRAFKEPMNQSIQRRLQQEILREAGLIPRSTARLEGAIQAPLRSIFRYPTQGN